VPDSAFSAKAAGTTAAEFLKIPNGARAEGMGQAVAGSAHGAEAMFWNPAGLARVDSGTDVTISYDRLHSELFSGAIGVARNTAHGVWGAGFVYFTQTSQVIYNTVGDSIGSFQPSDMAANLSYAFRKPSWLFGASGKVLRSNLGDVAGTSAAMDLGVQVLQLTDAGEGAVDAGLAIMNLGAPMKTGGSSDPLPMLMRIGVLWHTAPFLESAFDLNLPVDDDPFLAVGFEAHKGFGDRKAWKAFLRAGYNQKYSRGIEGFSGLTLGGGVDWTRFRADYAWVPLGDLGMTNRFTLAIRL
jgi:hypothetical protein